MSTPVTIIRHPKERLSKCSLEPLRGRPDLEFHKAHDRFTFDATGYILLAIDAPVISPDDAGHPLLLLDSTWRLLPQLMTSVQGEPILRTLPMEVRTAYPRVSKIAEDPTRGLASVEALYLAKKLLGEDDPSLLDHYYWRTEFLRQFEPA
ncbi:hypothetical protein [Cerasicoccus maritimus]|uniref:hypothetical protein n=1 Tax=Cerasicoccus maritimus TaxID=490089 RepID=UPI0028529818|nr:hypothetical protein [Cerasicoccus maritimus]